MSLLICLSLLLIVWQNIVIVALISRQRFLVSNATQFLSLLLRHCCSLALVVFVSGTLQWFVIGPVFGAAIVLSVSRLIFLPRHYTTGDFQTPQIGRALFREKVCHLVENFVGAGY